MKTKARLGVIAASMACVALGSALCLTTGGLPALAEESGTEPASNLVVCEQALSNVYNDVESIISGYNDTYKNDKLEASEIEYSSPVYLIEDNEYGMYLDFDADNGYAVITTDKKIYGLETSGDLAYLRDGKEIYYSYIDGFMYVDEDKQFHKYEENEALFADEIVGSKAKQNNENSFVGNATNLFVNTTASTNSTIIDYAKVYPGQTEAGDGEIDPSQINDYVVTRYPNFTLCYKYNKIADSFEYSHQFDTSYYIQRYSNGDDYSEGNCALNAMYNVLRDWGKRGYASVPYAKTNDLRTSILDDPLYGTYAKGTKTGKDSIGSYKWEVNDKAYLSVMPVLYSNIRSYGMKNGYTVSGYQSSKVPATMEYVANFLYDNNIDVAHTTSISTVTNTISSNKSCYLSINGSSTYGNHGVAVVGYYKYFKETKVNDSYSIIEYKYFYEIADGWHYSSRIFDPNTADSPKLNFYYLYLSRC